MLRAFNVEVARIQDQTSDSQTAAFRLQFWTDTIQKIYKNDQIIKNIPANPIAQELFKVIVLLGTSDPPQLHPWNFHTTAHPILLTKSAK